MPVIDGVQMVRTRATAQTEGRETETDTETDDDGRMTADVGSDAELEVTSDPLAAEYGHQSLRGRGFESHRCHHGTPISSHTRTVVRVL